MKWLLLSNKFPYPEDDGHSVALGGMLRGLLDNGQEVILFALNTSKHFRDLSKLPAWYKRLEYHAPFVDNQVTLAGLIRNLFTRESFMVSRFYTAEAAALLEDILRRSKPDVVQIEGVAMGMYLPVIRKNFNGKVVYRPHNVEHVIWQRQARARGGLAGPYLRLQARRLKEFEDRLARSSNQLLCISHADEDYFRRMSLKTALIPPSVELPQPAPGFEGSPKEVFHLASFDWLPNRDGMEWFLEQVWPLVQKQDPEIRLHLAGRRLPEEWKNRYGQGVVFHGYLEDPALVYRQCGIYIIPLRAGSGFRVKLIDALAHGLAVVSTAIGAEGSGLSPGEDFLLADTPEEFAQTILNLAHHPEQARQLARHGYQSVAERFNSSRLGKQVVNLVSDPA